MTEINTDSFYFGFVMGLVMMFCAIALFNIYKLYE